jgi:hypothetical protein
MAGPYPALSKSARPKSSSVTTNCSRWASPWTAPDGSRPAQVAERLTCPVLGWLSHCAKIAIGTRADFVEQGFGCTVHSQLRFGQLKIEDVISRRRGLRRRKRPTGAATRGRTHHRAYQAAEECSSYAHSTAMPDSIRPQRPASSRLGSGR